MPEETVILTPEQETLVINAFNGPDNPSITDLVRLAFPEILEPDGRTKEGRAIKLLLTTKGLKARATTYYQPKEPVILTESQKEFCRNNSNNKVPMSAVEMARTLFNKPKLTNLDMETRAIAAYLLSIETEETPSQINLSDIPLESYRPPKTVPGVLVRVDKYKFNLKIDKEAMSAQQKAGLESLLGYLNTFRFINQINLYGSQNARDLFESSFVRYTYDKPDLTEEEVDQFINVAHDNVTLAATHTRIEQLQNLLEEATNNNEDSRIPVSLVDAISDLHTEYNQTSKRQQALINDLKQKRSDRIAELRSANASILNLVQLWKEEKTRKKLLHLAEARKKIVAKAADELSGMEEVKARIMGLNIEEIING